MVLGWKVFSVGTPMFKPLFPMLGKLICGTYCGYPASGIMPRPFALLKPRSERLAKLPAGLFKWRAVRNTLSRASLTAVAPRVLVLLITNSCAREGETVGKPGTEAKPPCEDGKSAACRLERSKS